MNAKSNAFRLATSLVLSVCLFTFLYTYSAEAQARQKNYWPTKGWRFSTPEEQGMQSGMLADMLEETLRLEYKIDSIAVIRNGYVVTDAYIYPFNKETKHIIHSCTKSITSALVGIAIEKGFIKGVSQSILEFFQEKTIANLDGHKRAITLENLLTMASGLECRDSYLYLWTGLMEMMKSGDWAQHILDLPMSEAPGEKFEYCNGVSYLLSVIIQKTTNMKTLEFAKKYLFGPLGITDVKWKTSPQGIDIGWGEMWLKPHDMAKIGLLYLNKGRWEDRQIVPADWVEASTRRHIGGTLFEGYGYQWWIDPAGYYMAVGYLGQFIFVIPDKEMVAVFTSDLKDWDFYIPKKLLDQYIIPAAVSSRPLPANSTQTSRLHSLTNECSVGPAQRYIWLSEKEGVAKDGVFVRTTSPAFRFSYPDGSKKVAINYPNMIMTMKTPEGTSFSSSIHDIPEGMTLSEMGPKHFVSILSNVGNDIQITSNKEIVLKDGTKAYRTDINWLTMGGFPLTTLLTVIFKDGKCIYVGASKSEYTPEAELIVESVTLK